MKVSYMVSMVSICFYGKSQQNLVIPSDIPSHPRNELFAAKELLTVACVFSSALLEDRGLMRPGMACSP